MTRRTTACGQAFDVIIKNSPVFGKRQRLVIAAARYICAPCIIFAVIASVVKPRIARGKIAVLILLILSDTIDDFLSIIDTLDIVSILLWSMVGEGVIAGALPDAG